METPNPSLYSISKQFLVFGRGSELFFYNFRDKSEQSFNLSDVLSDVDFNTKIDNFNILALSTYSNNTNRVTKSESLRNKSEVSDIFVTVFLSNGFIVLLKHDTQLKYHFHHHILSTTYPQNVTVEHTGETENVGDTVETVQHTDNVEGERVLVSTIRVNDWYSFYVRGGVLYLLSWSRDRTVKLHDSVLHFSVCMSQDKLLLVLESSLCIITVDELFLSNCLHSPDPHLDDSHMEQLIDISTSGLKNILVSNKLVFLLYKEELLYTFLNKLSLYKFTPVLNVTFFNFQTVSDINLVLTIDTEYTVVIYDYDTVNTVITLKQMDLVSTTEGQSGDLRYNVCVLCDDMSLLLFDNHNLVHSVKLQLQDDKLVLHNVNNSENVTEDVTDTGTAKRNLEEKEEKEKEEERYKKLKSIRRKRFLDLEAVEFEDPPTHTTVHTTVHTMDDSMESNSQLSKASQDKETATTGTGTDGDVDVGEMGEGEYDIENYSYNQYGTENLMYLVSEMKKLKRKVKQLEYLAMPKEHKILTPGLCPKPNDQFKQWCLFWNEYGHISKQNNLENNNLQIYLFSGPLSGYIKKVDRFSCQMASLHLDGLVCGTNIFSSHPKDTQDHTQDITRDGISDVPVDNVQKKVGVVYYYNLYNNNENWDRRFPNEEIKAVSISSNYIAVVTHLNILYLLTRNNMLLNVSKLKGTIVSLLTNRNMLVVVTQIITNTHDTVYNVNILWINGIKGLTHNNTLKIITLYNDLLILNHTHIKHIGLSNEYVLWYMDSKYKLWLLINNIKNINNNDILEWIPTTNVNSNYYPLYINNFNLYYIKLRSGERYPNCGKNINFFGYTLHNLSITLNTETNTIINTHKGGNLRTEGASIGIDSSVFINTKLQVPESILENNIDIYDELRYLQNININQLQYIINIIQLYNYWYIQSENSIEHTDHTGHTMDKNEINKYLSNINIFEKNHDKLLLRILAKIQSTNKLYKNVDIIQMLKIPKCLEIAKTIVTNDRYRKLINESLILLQKSMTLNK